MAKHFYTTIRNKNGFSFVEIVVASVIFVIISAGVLIAMSNLRAPAETSKTKLQSAYVGKQITEELKNAVNAAIWDSTSTSINPLVPGQTYTIPALAAPFNNITGTYTVANNANNYRTVTFNIQYPNN